MESNSKEGYCIWYFNGYTSKKNYG